MSRETVPSATQGSTVSFANLLRNTGNATDSFDVTIAANSFPAGSTWMLYQADGVTPLLDSNGNGVLDPYEVKRAMEAGAAAYLLKNASAAELATSAERTRMLDAVDVAGVLCIEARARSRFADHAPGLHRLVEPLHLMQAVVGIDEEAAGEAARLVADRDRAGVGQALDARREIRRLPHHRVELREPHADHVADHRDAGRKADAHVDALVAFAARGTLEPLVAHRLDHAQARADRTLGGVFPRGGIAEVRQDAVADQPRDEAARLFDDPAARAVVGVDQVAQIFGIEAHRQCRRPDEVAEHDGDLAPLAGAGRAMRMPMRLHARRHRRLRDVALPLCQRVLEDPPMAQRKAETSQILLRQQVQRAEVDVLAREGVGMGAQAQRLEPAAKFTSWVCHSLAPLTSPGLRDGAAASIGASARRVC